MFVSSSGSSYTKFKTCYNKINDTCNTHYTKVQFCSRLHCWMDMMWDTKPLHPLSLTLLTLWCRLDHDSIFQLWVLCHEQGHPTLHFQDRRAVGAAMHRRISVWYWNSVVSQWSGYEWFLIDATTLCEFWSAQQLSSISFYPIHCSSSS
jgi:hypothetical protein